MLIDNNKIISDAPFCLCHVVFKGMETAKTLPTIIYNNRYNVYQMYCSKCGFKTFTDENKQAVISDWFYSNRNGDAHIKSCWINRYNKQNGTKIY